MGNGVNLMSVFTVLIDFVDWLLSTSSLVEDTLIFWPTWEKYAKRLQIISQTLEEHLSHVNLYQNNFNCVVLGNEVFEDPLMIKAVKELRLLRIISRVQNPFGQKNY